MRPERRPYPPLRPRPRHRRAARRLPGHEHRHLAPLVPGRRARLDHRVSDDSGTPGGIGRFDEYGVGGTSRFRYTGQYWIGEANLLYYRARIYDPKLGRFLQPDPIGYGDGMNLYAYVGGDPINAGDPSGLSGQDFICGGGSCLDIGITGGSGGRSSSLIGRVGIGAAGKFLPRMPGEGAGNSRPKSSRRDEQNICDRPIDTPSGRITPRQAARRTQQELAKLMTTMVGHPSGGPDAAYSIAIGRAMERLRPGGSWDPQSSAQGNYLFGAVAVQGLGLPADAMKWFAGFIEKYGKQFQ